MSLSSPNSAGFAPARPEADLTGIAAGRRKPRRRKAVGPLNVAEAGASARIRVDDLNVGFDAANLRRCPGCGGMVYLWPCLACGGRRAA